MNIIEKNLDELEKVKQKLSDTSYKLEMLEKRVRRLEQMNTYFSYTEEEIRNIKIGGTD